MNECVTHFDIPSLKIHEYNLNNVTAYNYNWTELIDLIKDACKYPYK